MYRCKHLNKVTLISDTSLCFKLIFNMSNFTVVGTKRLQEPKLLTHFKNRARESNGDIEIKWFEFRLLLCWNLCPLIQNGKTVTLC